MFTILWRWTTANIFTRIDSNEKWKIEVNGPWLKCLFDDIAETKQTKKKQKGRKKKFILCIYLMPCHSKDRNKFICIPCTQLHYSFVFGGLEVVRVLSGWVGQWGCSLSGLLEGAWGLKILTMEWGWWLTRG